MDAVKVPRPVFRVSYAGSDITADLTPFEVAVTWTNDLDGAESDSIELVVEDTDGRWWGGWYPRKGDAIELQIGYEGEPLLPCGVHQIDEIELQGPPSVVRIKALAVAVMKDLRTHKGHAYEDTTLAGIVGQVATRHGLTVVGDIEPVPIRRSTQLHEKDLKFLQRLAREYDHAFNVRGDKLVFYRLAPLRAAGAAAVLRPRDLGSYSIRDKLKDLPAASAVMYHDPKTKALMTAAVTGDSGVAPERSVDLVKLNSRAESPGQAQAKAKAAMNRADDEATEGTLVMFGRPDLVAGKNVELAEFGQLSGRWQIKGARHHIDRTGGYLTELTIRRVQVGAGAIPKGKNKGALKSATIENGQVVLR